MLFTFILTVVLLVFPVLSNSADHVLLYVGTYTDGASEGIYCYEYNPEKGDLVLKHVTANKSNPSFLVVSPAGPFLYSVGETDNYKNMDSGSVIAYKILENGILKEISQKATRGNHPCHVSVSPDGKTVVASNYSSGNFSIYSVSEDGGIDEVRQIVNHEGGSIDNLRQKGPHLHSSMFTVDGKYLVTADLGTDRINFYAYSPDTGMFVPALQEYISMKPGYGPRHFCFSPDGNFIYVMNEMGSAVSVLRHNTGSYSVIQDISSLPSGYMENNSGADIHISPDGRFAYCSNRGHNSIAVFERDENSGTLKLIQNEHVRGDWPRNFAISPDGRYLLVANQRSNDITVFSIDKQTGKLSFTGKRFEVPNPVCLKFYVNT